MCISCCFDISLTPSPYAFANSFAKAMVVEKIYGVQVYPSPPKGCSHVLMSLSHIDPALK